MEQLRITFDTLNNDLHELKNSVIALKALGYNNNTLTLQILNREISAISKQMSWITNKMLLTDGFVIN